MRKKRKLRCKLADGVEAGYRPDCKVVHLYLYMDGTDEPFAECELHPHQLQELADTIARNPEPSLH